MDGEKIKLSPLMVVSDDTEVGEEHLPPKTAMRVIRLGESSIIKAVARRRRLGTDLWKEIARKEYRMRKPQR